MNWWYMAVLFFFFKQKTAYEMRISDWSSDVCSSDLLIPSTLGDGFLMHDSEGNLAPGAGRAMPQPWVMHDGQRHRLDDSLAPGFLLIGRPGWSPGEDVWRQADELKICLAALGDAGPGIQSIGEEGPMIARWDDRKTVGQGKSVSVRV